MTDRFQEGNNEASIKQVLSGRKVSGTDLLFYLAGVLAILVCTFSLTGQFVLDDWWVLVKHPVFKDKLPIWQLFALDQWGGPLSEKITTYRPIMPLIWWPIWKIFPDNPFVFRLFTLLLHLAATFTVIKVGSLFVKDKWIVALAAILFAVHAVHAEVLGSIAHQNEIGAFIFCLWALYFVEKKPTSLISVLFLIIAVLIKESAIIFYPTILLFFIARRVIRQRIFLTLSIIAVAGIMIWLQLSFERAPLLIGNMDNLTYDAQGSERLLHGLHTIGRGVSLMLAPRGLAPFHGFASIDLSVETLLLHSILGGFALLLGAAMLLWGIRKKRSDYVLLTSILFGPLLLQSNLIIRTFAELSERWLYTPSLAVCFILSAILFKVYNNLKKKQIVWLGSTLISTIIVIHLLISWQVLTAWKTNDSLMAFAVKQEPSAYQSRYFHAKYLLQKDETYEGLWYATTSAMIKREYFRSKGRSGKKKFSVLSELDKLPLKERFGLAPIVIEPQQPCDYVVGSIVETANLKPVPPLEILNILAGLYASQGYAKCFSNPESQSQSVPLLPNSEDLP